MTHWEKLFGTPERAAETMSGKCCDCCECVIADACEHGCDEGCLLSVANGYDTLLKWLESEVDDD